MSAWILDSELHRFINVRGYGKLDPALLADIYSEIMYLGLESCIFL